VRIERFGSLWDHECQNELKVKPAKGYMISEIVDHGRYAMSKMEAVEEECGEDRNQQ
jgi:hypothetical protein